eukprot:514687-Amphidinium_carterae.1
MVHAEVAAKKSSSIRWKWHAFSAIRQTLQFLYLFCQKVCKKVVATQDERATLVELSGLPPAKSQRFEEVPVTVRLGRVGQGKTTGPGLQSPLNTCTKQQAQQVHTTFDT